jgi:SAM-dependent methyltransferase
VELDRRVARLYERSDEDARLWRPGRGELIRLRTWDIFGRFLPPQGRILDVGGGPGTHAAHLAANGYDVTLVDPMRNHVEAARQRATAGSSFTVCRGIARDLPAADGSVDAVLLMGPLYHLVGRADRLAALRETARVLRPGGTLLTEVITRHAWLLDAATKGRLAEPALWPGFEQSIETGLSQDPANTPDGAFWAYFHRPDDLRDELAQTGFTDARLISVEGFAWLLGDLEQRMAEPEPVLRALRLTEEEPSMLGCSAHVIGVTQVV